MGGARHYTELIAWQLADEIRRLVFPLTRRADYRADFRLRAQTDDAIDSVCRNTAEGFGGESHREFRRFLFIARNSLNELCDCLHSAQLKGYVTPADLAPILTLTRRLYPAIASLIRHLERPDKRAQ
jgi:four helix bundle protein